MSHEFDFFSDLTICSVDLDFCSPMDSGTGASERRPPLDEDVEVMFANVEVGQAEGLPLPGPEASGDELFRLGMLYSTGQGGAPLDYVSAHMLFNLAAMKGSIEAKIYRKELSQEMASEDVAEAQRAAREWLAQG
jgi:hypothetical protein